MSQMTAIKIIRGLTSGEFCKQVKCLRLSFPKIIYNLENFSIKLIKTFYFEARRPIKAFRVNRNKIASLKRQFKIKIVIFQLYETAS